VHIPAAPLSCYLRDRVKSMPLPRPFGGPTMRPLSRVNPDSQSICLSVSERVAPSAAAWKTAALSRESERLSAHHTQTGGPDTSRINTLSRREIYPAP
jgi:hypothetical protein